MSDDGRVERSFDELAVDKEPNFSSEWDVYCCRSAMFLTLTPRRPQNDTISDANLAVSDFPNEQQCFTLKEHEQQQQRINAERLLASPHALFL